MILTPSRSQTLVTSTSSASTSTGIPSTTAMVWSIGGGCHIAVGTNPTATTSNMCIPNNAPLMISLNVGDKISGRADSAAGHLVIAY